ncbi:hypothetical protein SS50377_24401 [Spironucleus salmonicida]|uniref:HECT domain-containing protein n=1 Tax=Spironucleus salmonicida TaxID=348837 RepID=V6LYY9_9EUKA|nr:hypothetical protein SS50377_24401 [Spironucleus salmonicida]|eukprot:EST46049.1 hypothetical protein SS50377_14039 [Spironucleus salmonicida]
MSKTQQLVYPTYSFQKQQFIVPQQGISIEQVLNNISKDKQKINASIQALLQAAVQYFVPSNLNNLLFAMTQSNEVYDLNIKPLNYFINILYLQQIIQTQFKLLNERSYDHEYTIQLSFILVNEDFDKLASYIEQNLGKIKNKDKTLHDQFQQLLLSIQAKQDFVISFDIEQIISKTTGVYTFNCIKNTMKYNLNRLSENLYIATQFMKSEYFLNYVQKVKVNIQALSPQVSQFQPQIPDIQLLTDVANEILRISGIPLDNSVQLIKLLAIRELGQDLTFFKDGYYTLVTPQQLVILLIDTRDKKQQFKNPNSYSLIYINQQPFYQLFFDIPKDFEPVSQLSQYHQRLMISFLEYLQKVSEDYYDSIPHRVLFIHSFSTNNILVKIPAEADKSCEFLIPAVPLGRIELQDLPPLLLFIHSNLKMDYVMQFILMQVISAGLLLVEPLSSQVEQVIQLGEVLGEDANKYKHMLSLTDKIVTLIKLISRSAQTPQLLYFCVSKNNIMNEQILAIFTILKCGFLSLKHLTLKKVLEFQLNHYEFIRFDRQTIWQTFLQHMQIFVKPDTQSVLKSPIDQLPLRDYLCKKMPNLVAFLESYELPYFGNTEKPAELCGQSSTSTLIGDLKPELAKNRLIALIHELQHHPRHSYLSEIDSDIPFLPQILADATSITPLSAAIRFHYKNQQGVDAGGMWRTTLTILFDDLLSELPITNDVLFEIKKAEKFGNRDLHFDELNEDNPNSPSLLKVINLNQKTILVPHYNGYNCQTSSSIYPRLTDKRSCLYYLGRIFSFCLIYSGRMPDFLHQNFWKSLVGGRLFFDDEVIRKYQSRYETDPMFKINGTKPYQELLYPLTMEEIQTYYKEYYQIWMTASKGEETDLDMLGVHPKIVEELQKQGINLGVQDNIKKYAKLAFKQLSSGQSLGKAYSEFRNGFRHPFATSMVTPVALELQVMAQQIDICFDIISWQDLSELMTFVPADEEYINREEIVSSLISRNIAQIELEQELVDEKIKILNSFKKLLTDSQFFSHKELLEFVFASTGQRSLRGTELTFMFIKPSKENKLANGQYERRLIQFHTCFNQADIPLGYSLQLSEDELKDYIKTCVSSALENGFAIM